MERFKNDKRIFIIEMGQPAFKFESGLARIVSESPFITIESYEADEITYLRHSFTNGHSSADGRILYENEKKALQRLQGLKGVEEFVQQYPENSFISKHPSGKPLVKAEVIPSDYFYELRRLIASMHSIGIARLNYENPNALLIDATGNPVITDFSQAVIYEQHPAKNRPSMASIAKEHMKGQVLRDYRLQATISEDLEILPRIKNYVGKVLSERKRKTFEEAKRYDMVYTLFLENRLGVRHLKPEEIIEVDRFILAQRGAAKIIKTPSKT